MKQARRVWLIVLIQITTPFLSGWGYEGHRRINFIACYQLKGNLGRFLSKNSELLKVYGPVPDYYKGIEAIQFTMSHDDGKKTEDIKNSDVILLGVSRTSKTPTSIYLANRGYKTTNIPLVPNQNLPEILTANGADLCVIGLYADPNRLSDIRRNRIAIMNENRLPNYTDIESIKKEIEESKKLFKNYNWPTIDVTRKSVEETAASIIKIIEIKKSR